MALPNIRFNQSAVLLAHHSYACYFFFVPPLSSTLLASAAGAVSNRTTTHVKVQAAALPTCGLLSPHYRGLVLLRLRKFCTGHLHTLSQYATSAAEEATVSCATYTSFLALGVQCQSKPATSACAVRACLSRLLLEILLPGLLTLVATRHLGRLRTVSSCFGVRGMVGLRVL